MIPSRRALGKIAVIIRSAWVRNTMMRWHTLVIVFLNVRELLFLKLRGLNLSYWTTICLGVWFGSLMIWLPHNLLMLAIYWPLKILNHLALSCQTHNSLLILNRFKILFILWHFVYSSLCLPVFLTRAPFSNYFLITRFNAFTWCFLISLGALSSGV